MDRDSFYRWLAEVQGIADPGTTPCDPPNFHIEEMSDPKSPYFDAEAYLGTREGTVIAWHLRDSDRVKVTIRNEKPGPQLMRTVRWMLGEEEFA